MIAQAVLLVLVAGPAAAQADETSIGGRLRAEAPDGRVSVSGAVITVTDSLDFLVGQEVTDDDGAWELELPGAGSYSVTLDPDSLHDGVRLVDPDRATITISVTAGQRAGAIFRLTTLDESGGSSWPAWLVPDNLTMDRFLQRVGDGLKLGALIAMMAVGLSLVFGVTGLVNFAHGEMVTFGAVVAWYLNAWEPGPQVHLLVAAPLAVVAGAALGGGTERLLWRPLRRRRAGLVAMLLISIGLSMVIRYFVLMFFGGGTAPYRDYTIQRERDFGPFSLPPKDLFIILTGVVVLVGVALLLQRTRLGTATRAVADNPDLARVSGINVDRVILAVWVSAGALAAGAGVMFGVTERIRWDLGFEQLLLMFAAVILGGIGTAYGTIAGAMIVGLVTQVSTLWIDIQLRLAVSLFVLIVVLLVRPQGIFGERERIG